MPPVKDHVGRKELGGIGGGMRLANDAIGLGNPKENYFNSKAKINLNLGGSQYWTMACGR